MSIHDISAMGFKKTGTNVRIYAGARIVGCEHISIGSNVIIDDFVLIYATAPMYIGDHVHVASFVSISGGGEVSLADFSGLSSGVRILAGSEDFLGGGLTNPTIPARFRKVERASVSLGRHAIVGANTTVLPGVAIGDGCAVGANSLVNKSLPEWGVYFGSPVRRIQDRPSENILRLERELRAGEI